MKNPILIVLPLFLFVYFLPARAGSPPAETMKIDTNKSGMKVPAFPHKKHTELTEIKGQCTTCHHTSKEGETPKGCGICHTSATEKDPKTQAIGFKDAFHKKCLGCHEKQKDKPELKKCKNCHG